MADVLSDTEVAEQIARVINRTLELLSPRLAVALWYQTGRDEPALYLCHESVENCMKVLLTEAKPDVATATIARLTQTRDDAVQQKRPDWLQSEVLRSQLGPLLNPGNWSTPADPVIVDATAEPQIYQWAKAAFNAFDARRALPEEEQTAAYYRADQSVRDVLWAALDLARKTFTGRWPPISFVSGDDGMETVIPRIVARQILPDDRR